MPCGIVKLLLRSSEVKCSAYRAEGTLHARSALHELLAVLFTFRASGTLSSKNALLSFDKSAFFVGAGGGGRTRTGD